MWNKLLNTFESFLGESKRGVSENGQCQFDCPECNDGKFNLECNFGKGVFKCWSCQDNSGKLSTLIKKYGDHAIFEEYKQEINDIRTSRLYILNKDGNLEDIDIGENLFELPNCCQKINPNNYKHKKAYEYLTIERGIDLNIIKKYNICCTQFECSDWKMRNRIVIPSYDKFNSLNYYVGRLYQENKYQTKYQNAEKNKKDIIFNECLINWDGDVRLLEGPFDHIVVPNSIPILGKELDRSFYLYHQLMEKANSITLLGDGEAFKDWIKIYKNLNHGRLKGKIKIVNYNSDEDPSSIFKNQKNKGIAKLLHSSYKIPEFKLLSL